MTDHCKAMGPMMKMKAKGSRLDVVAMEGVGLEVDEGVVEGT